MLNEIPNVNIYRRVQIQSLIMDTKIEHKNGQQNEEFTRNIPVFILHALKVHGQLSLNKLAKETGYNYLTVKKHLPRLIKDGLIKEVKRPGSDYALAKREDLK